MDFNKLTIKSGEAVAGAQELARLKVSVPQKLSTAEKEALEGYQKVSREQPRERAFS